MDDISEQLARRDRYRRELARRMTYDQRWEAMQRLQKRAWAMLLSNPEGYAHFLRRNYKARALRSRNPHAR